MIKLAIANKLWGEKEKKSLYTLHYPPNLFTPCSPPDPYSSVHEGQQLPFIFSCHAHVTAAAFLHSREIGLQTQHHLSAPQTRRHQHQPAQNCVTPLMKATDANPLVSTASCLHSAVMLLSLVPPYLYLRTKTLFFFFLLLYK